jgi:putative phosphoesterase
MKIAIVSDTHDNTPAVVWIIEYLNLHKITTCLHAGDLINPGIVRRFAKHYQGHLHFVFGNNDGEQSLLTQLANTETNLTCHHQEMRLELQGKKMFMNHYSSISESVALSQEFDICIGGHDHQYRIIKNGNSLFINPGNTVTKDKWLPQDADKESGFVILNLDKLTADHILLPNEFKS